MTAALQTHLGIIRSAAHELELECERYSRESSGVMPAANAVTFPETEAATDPNLAIELPIRRGEAVYTAIAAFSNLVGAVCAFERVVMSLARGLDATR